MQLEFLRIVGDYDTNRVSDETALHCKDETLTDQSFKDESDINTIIDRFGIGEHPVTAQQWVTDVDITEAATDYQSVLNQMVEAAAQFNSLPAKIRSRFDNDPHLFVEFVSDAANVDEMIRLGLAERRPDPVPSDTDRIVKAIEDGRAQDSP